MKFKVVETSRGRVALTIVDGCTSPRDFCVPFYHFARSDLIAGLVGPCCPSPPPLFGTSDDEKHEAGIQSPQLTMPMIYIKESRAPGKGSLKLGPTFNGDVWADPILAHEDFTIMNVMFTPATRTHWHTHEKEQLLTVKAGSGWICDKGGKPQKLSVGDIVWCPPGTTHWHGADKGSYMLHTAVTHGSMEWLEPVSDEEYNGAQSS